MSQNDHVIANANGATVRADINSALQALASANSGSTAPSTTYNNQWWFDTTNDILKIRDEANANWVNVASLVGTTWVPYSNGSLLGTLANQNASAVGVNVAMNAKHVAFATTAVSSGTPDFATSGNVVTLSGTATANTLGTVQAGFIGIIHYGVALTITHNGLSRILPSASNIPAQIGDVEFVLSLGSGNWRTINYMRASGRALASGAVQSAKTGSYTALVTDFVIPFSGLTADATCTLPSAASFGQGNTLWVINDDSNNWAVTIDPAGLETVDGFSTRKTWPRSKIGLVSDGTNWRTFAGRYRAVSAAATPALGTQFTVAHGFGVKPDDVRAILTCGTANAGYSAGETVVLNPNGAAGGGGTQAGVSVWSNATDIGATVSTTSITIPNKGTGTMTAITLGNWSIQVIAEAA